MRKNAQEETNSMQEQTPVAEGNSQELVAPYIDTNKIKQILAEQGKNVESVNVKHDNKNQKTTITIVIKNTGSGVLRPGVELKKDESMPPEVTALSRNSLKKLSKSNENDLKEVLSLYPYDFIKSMGF